METKDLNQSTKIKLTITQLIKSAADSLQAEPYLNRRQIAQYFGVAESTIRYWVSCGMPYVELDSGRKLYGKQSITDWLASQEKRQTKKPVSKVTD